MSSNELQLIGLYLLGLATRLVVDWALWRKPLTDEQIDADLLKDAMRYRWLRPRLSGDRNLQIWNKTGEGLDAAIDAAIEAAHGTEDA